MAGKNVLVITGSPRVDGNSKDHYNKGRAEGIC